MTALASYSTGTVTVAAGGTTVTGTGTIWSGTNVKPGDILQIGNFQSVISDVTDTATLVIPPWGGGAQAGVAYKIWQWFPQRVAGAQAMATVSQLVAAFESDGFFVFVDTTETVPDPSLGNDGQYAFQPTTGKTWVKSGGVWSYLGIYKGFNFTGAYNGATTYSVGDVMTDAGSSYVWINPTPGSGHTAPNTTYWQLLASIGATGNTGPTGAGYGGTSTTSLAIGTGSKVFTTQSGLAYQNGARVRASSAANTSNWMEGLVTYSGTTLTMTSDKTNGSGTLADWNFNVVGQNGAGDLSSTNNLSDVANVATARANLGIDIVSQGRITLTSGSPVSGSVSGASQFYFTPYNGNLICIYDGTKFVPVAFSEVSQLNTDATKSPAAVAASKNYDLFAWLDSGTFRVTRGPVWTGDNTRGSGAGTSELTRVNGILVNAQAITNGPAAQRGTYVGTIRSNASSTLDFYLGGSASGGSAGALNVWNMYNRLNVAAASVDSGTSYTTNSSSRQARASTGNQINFIAGLAEESFSANYTGRGTTAASAGAVAGLGLGINGAGLTVSYPIQTPTAFAVTLGMSPSYVGTPSLGYNFVAAMEFTDGSTATFNSALNNTVSLTTRM